MRVIGRLTEAVFSVRVDISLPLCRGRVLSIEDGDDHWVTFKYERLPNICYWCGCLDHSEKDCDRWLESEGTLKDNDRVYGAWIRAAFAPASRKTVVVVPGFYEDKKGKQGKPTKPVPGKYSSPASETGAAVTKPVQGAKTVTEETEEQIMGSMIALDSLSAETAKGDNHGIKGSLLDEQILEIDRELNGIEISGDEIRGVIDANKGADLDAPHNKEGKNESSAGFETEEGAEHVPNISENPNITKEILQPVVCGKISGNASSEQNSTRTWIRLSRKAKVLNDEGKGGSGHSIKRSFMEVEGCEGQKKRRLALSKSKTNLPVVEAECQSRQEQ